MNRFLLIFTVICSFAAGWFFGHSGSEEYKGTVARPSNKSDTSSYSSNRSVNADSEATSSPVRTKNVLVEQKTNTITHEKPTETIKRLVSRREKELNSRLERYLGQADISEEDKKKIEAIATRTIEEYKESLEQMYDGDTFINTVEESVFDVSSFEKIKEILSEVLPVEELENYDEFLKKEAIGRVESRALQRLAKLQFDLRLTEEQKDLAYSALFDQVERVANETNPLIEMFDRNGGREALDAAGVSDFFKLCA